MKNSKLLAVLLLSVISLPSFAAQKNVNHKKTSETPIAEKQKEFTEAKPITPFSDTRLILFQYDQNLTYPIKSREGLYTHIEVDKDDVIKGFYLSDTLRWKYHVSGDKKRIFIKPTAPGLFTAATLVTSNRTYEITFASVSSNSDWYQRITWSYPVVDKQDANMIDDANGVYEDVTYTEEVVPFKNTVAYAQPPQSSQIIPTELNQDIMGSVDPLKMRFGYKIEGEAPFKPTTVFDDGKFTWLRFDKRLQDMPAIFTMEKDGTVKLLNYTIHGDYVLVSRLVDGILLKLGSQEVKVTTGLGKKCGFFGC